MRERCRRDGAVAAVRRLTRAIETKRKAVALGRRSSSLPDRYNNNNNNIHREKKKTKKKTCVVHLECTPCTLARII